MTGVCEQFEKALTYSQEYPFKLDCEKLIAQWEEAKKPFIDLFGGQPIWKSPTPISVKLSKDERGHKFSQFMDTLRVNEILSDDFYDFLFLNSPGFFDNTVVNQFEDIKPGQKISKAFKKFIKDPQTVRWAQDIASQYIQSAKIEGNLYLSVHPLDFLTLSENNENWRSCHSLDGEFRTGNLSYMVDKVTCIAYISNGKNQKLIEFPNEVPWNSKKWRMLIHIGKNCVYYNRQYPFDSRNILDEVATQLNSLLKREDSTTPLCIGYRAIRNHAGAGLLSYMNMNIGGRSYDARDIINSDDYKGFCDLISSSLYEPVVTLRSEDLDNYTQEFAYSYRPDAEDTEFKRLFGIKIGEDPRCPCCGSGYSARADNFLCMDCIAEYDADIDFFLACSECGRKIHSNDEVVWVEDGKVPICKKCMKEKEENGKRECC